ncbi:Proline iminopeptidase [Penicillium macrosclerotiorum]|uniref:Proline iminopeptidase n=1 Tax=Penicillium macrosclerotiorum TaxID=303699 RepID=UPI002548F5E0|nr:Proline iminopeptidase [Penicillium macrosclerotiorum]KAJ5668677.1 Proline iminopeptidase [Penicillium macrosclerotiorum]
MADTLLDPGIHKFTAPGTGLTLEYVVYRPSSISQEEARRNLILVQCPGWGLGSEYLERGLSELWNPSTEMNRDRPAVYPVLFFHPRGTNGSSRPLHARQMSTMPDMASDLDDLRRYLQLEQFSVMLGHSNGGAIVLAYAQMYPERVQKLILLNHQVVGMQDRKKEKLEATQNNPAYRNAWQNLLSRTADTDEEFTESVKSIWPLYFYNPARYVDELVEAIGNRAMPAWCYHSQGKCDRDIENSMQMVDGMSDVQAKTLIIFGRDDMICGLKIAIRTMEIRGAELITYKECGHFPWIEQKEYTLEDIRRFIERRYRG